MYVFVVSIPNDWKEREMCKFEKDFKKFFVCILI